MNGFTDLYKVTECQIAVAVHVVSAVAAATMPLWYNSDALEGEEEQRMKFIRGSLYAGLLAWTIICAKEVIMWGDSSILRIKELWDEKDNKPIRCARTVSAVVAIGLLTGILYVLTLQGGKQIWFFKTNTDRKRGVIDKRMQYAGEEEIDNLGNKYEIQRHKNRLIRMKAMDKANEQYLLGADKAEMRKTLQKNLRKNTRLEGSLRSGRGHHSNQHQDHYDQDRHQNEYSSR